MTPIARHAAVLGGNRIPFARQNGPYAHASNQDMFTAALDGLVSRFGLQGRPPRRGRRGRRPQAQPRLQPDPRVRARLRARRRDARLRRPAGVRHRAARPSSTSPTRSPSGRSRCGVAGGFDTTSDAPIEVNEDLRELLLDLNRAKSVRRPRGPCWRACGRARSCPRIPRNEEPRTGPLDGRAPGDLDQALGRSRASRAGRVGGGEPPASLAAAYDRGFFDDLVTPVPGPRARPEPAARTRPSRSWRS